MKNKQPDGVVKAKFKLALSGMPELNHWQDRARPFDIEESEVVKWAVKQPAVLEFLFDRIRSTGMIAFDSGKRTWSGVEVLKPAVPLDTGTPGS